jgi:nitroreductase
MKVTEAIDKKRAVRKFSKVVVPSEIILAIVDAGRKAQSSKNTQPCRFIVVTDKQALFQLSQFGRYATHLADASFCVAILTPDPAQNTSIFFDAGQTAAYLQLAALEFGVGSCVIKLHQGGEAKDFLNVPNNFHLEYVIAMGFSKQKSKGELPRLQRLALNEILYWGKWGVSADQF